MSVAFTCGVPDKHCSGSSVLASAMLRGSCRVHPTPEDAFRCKVRYLINVEGYTQIGPREFRPKDGGPILVLTKKSKFGGVLRYGKRGDSGAGSKSRVMPRVRTGGCIGD